MSSGAIRRGRGAVRVVIPLAFLFAGAACGVSSAEHQRVVAERDSLQRAVEDLEHGAPRLLAQAQAALRDSAFERARDVAADLVRRHPDALEAKAAGAIQHGALAALAARERAAARADSVAKAANAARLARALAAMARRHDDVQDVTFYRDRTSPERHFERNAIYLYIVDHGHGAAILHLVIQYSGDDWLFLERFRFKIDDESAVMELAYPDVERDNAGGSVWEWYDRPLEYQRGMIDQIIASKRTVLRLEGKQYYRDHVVTAEEKAAMRRVLDAEDVLAARK